MKIMYNWKFKNNENHGNKSSPMNKRMIQSAFWGTKIWKMDEHPMAIQARSAFQLPGEARFD